MALERHRTHLFDTLALPPLHEAYRTLVYRQLYANFRPTHYESVCWATPEIGRQVDHQSDIVVLPGEERFLVEEQGVSFSHISRTAAHCPHSKTEHPVKLDKDMEGAPVVTVRTTHYCSLQPDTRPLLCRLFPFRIARVPGDNRKMVVLCEHRALKSILQRRGSAAVTQTVHDATQLGMSLWAFLSDKWWDYYEGSFAADWKFRELGVVAFSLTDDLIVSRIRGAPPAWRAEVLAQLATASCEKCSGSGVEFWDAAPDGTMLPVPQRRFDLCRTCVLPHMGMAFNGLLIDPGSRKILNADGTQYRGDTLLKEDT